MRFYKPLDYILGTKSRVVALRYLVQSGLELNGREIARAVGMSPKPLNQVLTRLADEGVLLMRSVGSTYLFRLNLGNVLVNELIAPLFQKEQNMLERALSEALEGVPGVFSAVLFGSAARREAGPDSDVDLLVVTNNGDETQAVLEERATGFLERYGNLLSFLVMPSNECRERYRRDDDFLREAMADGRVVAGEFPSELLIHDAD